MICIFVILLTGWCRMRMRPVRLVSYVFLYTTVGQTQQLCVQIDALPLEKVAEPLDEAVISIQEHVS